MKHIKHWESKNNKWFHISESEYEKYKYEREALIFNKDEIKKITYWYKKLQSKAIDKEWIDLEREYVKKFNDVYWVSYSYDKKNCHGFRIKIVLNDDEKIHFYILKHEDDWYSLEYQNFNPKKNAFEYFLCDEFEALMDCIRTKSQNL